MTIFNTTVDCGAPPPPINGLLQLCMSTTEDSVVLFWCNSGFVPEGVMVSVCGRDGQWTPNPGGVTCSPRLTLTPTPTQTSTSTEPGEKELLLLYGKSQFIDCGIQFISPQERNECLKAKLMCALFRLMCTNQCLKANIHRMHLTTHEYGITPV